MAFFDRLRREPSMVIHVIIRGRIGEHWYDIDRDLCVPQGATLGRVLELGEKRGIPFAEALQHSPHLRHTLMLNGERCPVDDHRERVLEAGDQLYMLAPIAGG